MILFLTQANNFVLHTAFKCFGLWSKQSGKCVTLPHIVTTTVEHDAILLPLKHLEDQEQIGMQLNIKHTSKL